MCASPMNHKRINYHILMLIWTRQLFLELLGKPSWSRFQFQCRFSQKFHFICSLCLVTTSAASALSSPSISHFSHHANMQKDNEFIPHKTHATSPCSVAAQCQIPSLLNQGHHSFHQDQHEDRLWRVWGKTTEQLIFTHHFCDTPDVLNTQSLIFHQLHAC